MIIVMRKTVVVVNSKKQITGWTVCIQLINKSFRLFYLTELPASKIRLHMKEQLPFMISF
jgi:hypothetical protein